MMPTHVLLLAKRNPSSVAVLKLEMNQGKMYNLVATSFSCLCYVIESRF